MNELTLSYPVTVYDIEAQKPVLVFPTPLACGRYVFNRQTNNEGAYVRTCVEKRIRCRQNRFQRKICFRKAKPEYVSRLGNKAMLILDDRFDIPAGASLANYPK